MLKEIVEDLKLNVNEHKTDIRKEGKNVYVHSNYAGSYELGYIEWVLNIKDEDFDNKKTLSLRTSSDSMCFIKEGKNKFSLKPVLGNGTGSHRIVHIDFTKKYFTSDEIFEWVQILREKEKISVSDVFLERFLDLPLTTSNVIPEKEIKDAKWYLDINGADWEGLPNLSCSGSHFNIVVYKENGEFLAFIETFDKKIFANHFKAKKLSDAKASKSLKLILLKLHRIAGTSMPPKDLIEGLNKA